MPYKDPKKRLEANRAYRKRNLPVVQQKAREYVAKNRDTIREKGVLKYYEQKKRIFDFYGYVCKCCGEDNPRFLTIDHVYNDGYKHRGMGSRIYQVILKDIAENGADRYQIFCYNCNCAKRLNDGVCPHKIINKD